MSAGIAEKVLKVRSHTESYNGGGMHFDYVASRFTRSTVERAALLLLVLSKIHYCSHNAY